MFCGYMDTKLIESPCSLVHGGVGGGGGGGWGNDDTYW